MKYLTKLKELGFTNIEIMPYNSCCTYLANRGDKKYFIKGLPSCDCTPSPQIRNELLAGKILRGMENVLVFDEVLFEDELIARPYLDGRELSLDYAVKNKNLLKKLNEIIHSIHKRGVANMDLFEIKGKVKNILLNPSNEPFFIDFGIAAFKENLTEERFNAFKKRDEMAFNQLFGRPSFSNYFSAYSKSI